MCGPFARMADEACRSMSRSFGPVVRTQLISSSALVSSATGRHGNLAWMSIDPSCGIIGNDLSFDDAPTGRMFTQMAA